RALDGGAERFAKTLDRGALRARRAHRLAPAVVDDGSGAGRRIDPAPGRRAGADRRANQQAGAARPELERVLRADDPRKTPRARTTNGAELEEPAVVALARLDRIAFQRPRRGLHDAT